MYFFFFIKYNKKCIQGFLKLDPDKGKIVDKT